MGKALGCRADSPGSGAGTQGFAAHLISQKSKIFDSFSSRRSLGCGRSMIAPTRGREIGRVCRRCGGGWEVVLRQSLRLPVRADTSLYTREARGAAAPEEGFGCGGGRRLCGRSMIAPTYTTGNVTNSHCFSAKSNLFSHGTGNPSPTFSIATELCNFELKYRR